MSGHHYDDDDKPETAKGKKQFEFDCASCNSNNPWPDGFTDKEEVLCHYCGTTYLVRMSDEGKLKLKEI